MDKEGTENTEQRPELDDIIKKHAYWAAAAGLIPIPVADAAAVSAIQLDMLKGLCEYFEIDYTKEAGKSMVSSLVSASLASLLARAGASAVKSIPVVGTTIGITSMSLMSGATTYALGQVFAKHFESGGTFASFNADKMKAYYKEKIEEGKEAIQKMKDKYGNFGKKKKAADDELNAAKKMKELKKLLKKDLISKKEYEKMRAKILKDLMKG